MEEPTERRLLTVKTNNAKSSRRSGGSREKVAFRPEARKTINIKTLACKRQNITIKLLLQNVI